MKHILDELDHIEASVPGLQGRLDRSRVAIAGHSLGGHTAAMLMGARLTDPQDGTVVDMAEPRFKAGVVIGAPGKGGADLSAFAAEHYPELGLEFSEMKTPGLVVAGDKDSSPYLTVRGADWRADPYFLSTGPKSLLKLLGGEHGLGGISGYDAGETTDESPERVAAVQRLTWAYLRSVLCPGDPAWSTACSTLESLKDIGRVESK
jgi:pimeloyl-ACP methyl ester carboxylesterase